LREAATVAGMPRRRSRPLPVSTWLLLLLPAAAAGFLGWRAMRGTDTPFPEAPELHTADYFENANSLRGNTYRVTGTVEDSLRWSADHGRLISVIVRNPDGSPGDPLPIAIPPSITDNVQAGQSFVFKLKVGEGGVLTAEAMAKN
jgi:hypothetical protein